MRRRDPAGRRVDERIEHAPSWPFAGRAAQDAARTPFGNIVEILHEWVTTVDHKKIGILYILYSLMMLVAGGIEILLIRLQLAGPRLNVVPAEVFNRLFTMHGTTMIFFVAMPIFVGFANYLVPLMLGVRDIAFPRLNAFSFWMTAFGGLLLYYSFLGGMDCKAQAPRRMSVGLPMRRSPNALSRVGTAPISGRSH